MADEDVPELALAQGDRIFMCPTAQVVYPEPILPAVLAEMLFPGDWSILPPG